MAHDHYNSDVLAIDVALDSIKNIAKREQNVVLMFVLIIKFNSSDKFSMRISWRFKSLSQTETPLFA